MRQGCRLRAKANIKKKKVAEKPLLACENKRQVKRISVALQCYTCSRPDTTSAVFWSLNDRQQVCTKYTTQALNGLTQSTSPTEQLAKTRPPSRQARYAPSTAAAAAAAVEVTWPRKREAPSSSTPHKSFPVKAFPYSCQPIQIEKWEDGSERREKSDIASVGRWLVGGKKSLTTAGYYGKIGNALKSSDWLRLW